MIKATGALPYLVKHLALAKFEKDLSSKLLRQGQKAAYPSELDKLVRHCAIALSIDTLPETVIVQSSAPNAFTFGSGERAFVVVNSGTFNLLTKRELTALFAHELGHVKSGHMLYHTVAEILGGGIGFSASVLGLGLVMLPVRLALLSWHRESEVTADRGSLLVVNDINVIKSFMTRIALWSRDAAPSKGFDIEKEKVGVLESASELLRTHPLHANRFRLAKEFFESEQFLAARRKIDTRLGLLRALIPVCRFCGAAKPAYDQFCPTCGRCQT
jgi:Zn-dependent protease with chaperone function